MNLLQLLNRLIPAPQEWFEGQTQKHSPTASKIPAVTCTSWEELIVVWKRAMTWTDSMDITLSSMLAIVASTKLQEDQVWLRVIGIAGTAKTTLCEALSANTNYTFSMSVQRGFHSGDSRGGGDSSLFSRMDGKTTIINEGDTLLTSPTCGQTLSEMRDLWSGQTRAVYRNGVSYEYHGLKTTFIIAGTGTLRRLNKSAAGDRFLDCIIYEKESVTKERALVTNILENSLDAMMCESNGDVSSRESPEKYLAKQTTSGFIDYIRSVVSQRLLLIKSTPGTIPKAFSKDCEAMGLLVAYMRTRATGGDEDKTEKELHVRLSKQLAKIALCTAVVMGKSQVDAEVMRRMAHIADDTCYGVNYEVAKCLMGKSLGVRGIALTVRKPEELVRKTLGTLLELEVVKVDQSVSASGAIGRGKTLYRLSIQAQSLLNHLRRLMKEPINVVA
jgi:hypothetical protein